MKAKRLFLFSLVALLGATFCSATELEAILQRLDNAIARSPQADSVHMRDIATVRLQGASITDPRGRYVENRRMFRFYETYISDSALYYLDRNIDIARELGDDELLTEALLSKSSVLSRSGLYIAAIQQLSTIDPSKLSRRLLENYYHVYFSTYQYIAEYCAGTKYVDDYVRLRDLYCDSTMHLTSRDSFIHQCMMASKLAHEGRYSNADSYIRDKLNAYRPGTREYSILSSLMAFNYQCQGDEDNRALWLARSALSDVEGSVKENMSLRSLAEVLYERGNLERANRYLKKSMDDAVFFASRLRGQQSAALLPIIDHAYEREREANSSRLLISLCIMVVLALFAVALLVMFMRQVRKVKSANRHLHAVSEETTALNNELKALNAVADETNRRLVEANKLKEVSLRSFMELSSTSINTMEQLRNTLYNKMKTGKTEELKKILTSNQAVNESVREFYATFDEAFLSIFPTFVDDVNALFPADHRFDTVGLNSELRILALLRMGLTDNQRIAMFLRCSLSTVYTYRSRMKSRALDPDGFEGEIGRIGAI